jgi:dephospho-CoA kinase
MEPLQIGVTGGIGSGKSLVCKIFSCLGIPVYDADSRAKNLMNKNTLLVDQIKKEFGNDAYDEQGKLNRQYLAGRVFNQPDQLEKLNHLVHPRVAEDYSNWVTENNKSVYVIKEAALLFEAGSAKALDKIITVYAPEHLRLQRVLKRDPHKSEEAIEAVMHNQMNEEEKKSLADFIIYNDDTTLVIPQVLKLHEQFSS